MTTTILSISLTVFFFYNLEKVLSE